MTNSPRFELLQIQKRLYQKNKKAIDDSILIKEPHFDRYQHTYNKYVSKYHSLTTPSKMLKAVFRSDIIYVGDYHTLNQSQRSFLRLLKAVVQKDHSIIVALELLHTDDQVTLERYLRGEIGEKRFLNLSGLRRRWVFDLWENFQPIFDFCRFHKIPIKACDAAPPGSSLKKRDQATGELIAHVSEENPSAKIFVFVGDLHIAPPHLPSETDRALRKRELKRRNLILYQNSVPIYWKLAELGLEDRTDVVRIDERSFCRMHTPPIVAQRSYLNWLEHEEGEIDYSDARHSFLELVERVCSFLRIRMSKKDLDSVEVFTAGDLSFLIRLRQTKVFSIDELKIIKQQIMSSESYYIAKARFVYLANLSLNHAAEEAAHFIKHVKSGAEEPRELIDAFYANILHEAISFCGSKIINHRRKAPHESDFRNLLAYFRKVGSSSERHAEEEVAYLLLKYLKYERKGRPLSHAEIFRSRRDLFLAITHALGYMLGERLYYGLVDGWVKKIDIRKLIYNPWKRGGEPFRVYWNLQQRLRDLKLPRRM